MYERKKMKEKLFLKKTCQDLKNILASQDRSWNKHYEMASEKRSDPEH